MTIVPDDAGVKERARLRHQRFEKLTEGKSKRFRKRMARVELAEAGRDVQRVRVLPKNDEFRKFLVHPNGNLAFPEAGGSVEWPLDQFTLRRLRDGDVTQEAQEAPGEQRSPRSRSGRPSEGSSSQT